MACNVTRNIQPVKQMPITDEHCLCKEQIADRKCTESEDDMLRNYKQLKNNVPFNQYGINKLPLRAQLEDDVL